MYEVKQIKAGSNCYLLTQGDSSILIDTGITSADQVLRQCEGKNVKLIVLTHGHIDHIKNAAYLSKKLDAPIAMNENDDSLVKDNLSREMKSRGFLGNIVRFFSVQSAKGAKIENFESTLNLTEGMSLSEYGVDATITELPGHTAGSIGVIAGENFFVGDALMHMFGPEISLLFEDRKALENSAQKITQTGDVTIYFGHGAPVKNRKWC